MTLDELGGALAGSVVAGSTVGLFFVFITLFYGRRSRE